MWYELMKTGRKKERVAAKDPAKKEATARKQKIKEMNDAHKAAAKAARAKRVAEVACGPEACG